MRSLATKFTKNSILHDKSVFPVCIGQEGGDKNMDWIEPSTLKFFKDECPFKIHKQKLYMSISDKNVLSISGVLVGKYNSHQNKKYVEKVLSESEFIEQLTNMLKFYRKKPWYICMDGQDLTCECHYINSIFS